ncbi:Dabb family protein [Antiquaquibacter soli]|uniref:Dabb family protein n=1 Tax=Antiquaquibacter soli TaxID=3064523 RepID=A0ABT9BIK7_9MICO|nr:Dabb family protein [Protaetiibacter sp. WY-16]MDO7880859.1 Dabb family protein [Protaetiibacter sp. WY-16]
MIKHIVTWKLSAEDAAGKAESAAVIKSELEGLVGVIDEIVSLEVRANEAYADVNWDVVLIAEYESLAGLDAYQVHPAHQAAAAIVRQHVAARASVDFEV